MKFKYHEFKIEVEEFDFYFIKNALFNFMWEERYPDYEEYLARRRADFEAEDAIQREYGSSYNIMFGMECAEQQYYDNLSQECDWIVNCWEKQFNNTPKEDKLPRKRKNALTGRL